MTTALVIEDDKGIRTVLAMMLADEGLDVIEAESAERGLIELGANTPDLIIVDLMLGGLSGTEFIRAARRVTDAPITVVSALRDSPVVIEALELGADDYITKPFDVEVLAARCRALLRRAGRVEATPDDVVLDADRQLVLHEGAGFVSMAGEDLHLTKTEYRVLVELAGDEGRVLSRAQLLERIWDTDRWVGDERLVDVHVRRLRTKVERDPAAPELIVTVRGQGYRLDRR